MMTTTKQFQVERKRALDARCNRPFIGFVVVNLLICPLVFCGVEMPKVTKNCLYCGNEFTRMGHRTWNPTYCSRRCFYKARHARWLESCPLCLCGCGQRVSNPKNRWISGHNSRNRPPEVVEIMSRNRKGKGTGPKSKEHRKAISKGRIGMRFTDQHRSNLSKAFKGIPKGPNSPEHNRRISEGKMGHVVDEQTREKLRIAAERNLREGRGFKKGIHKAIKCGKLEYQSSYEELAYKILDADGSVVKYSCPSSIIYFYKGEKHTYIPDIFVEYMDGVKTVVEVKPKEFTRDPVNVAKWLFAKRYCKKQGWRFEVWTQHELGLKCYVSGKASKERYRTHHDSSDTG